MKGTNSFPTASTPSMAIRAIALCTSPVARQLQHRVNVAWMGANVDQNSHGEGLDAALNHGRQTAAEPATKRQMWALERQSQRSSEEEDLLRRLRDADRKGIHSKVQEVTIGSQ